MASVPPPNPTLASLAAHLSEKDARELVRIFLAEFPQLREELAHGTRKQSFIAAHSLKSSAQHMGLTGLSERLADLESRLEDPAYAITEADVEGVTRDFDRDAPSLQAYAEGG